jgi:hypothetical protein
VHRFLFLMLVLVTFAVACGETESDEPSLQEVVPLERAEPGEGELVGLHLLPVATGLSSPVWAVAPPNDERLFIVEKSGTVRILSDGVVKAQPFLDLSDLVSTDHLERGLLGLAFHPEFAGNGRLVAFYTDLAGNSQVVEYRLDSDNEEQVDLASARPLLSIKQFHPAHQGGAVAFGPDGYLWVTVGDGGILSDGEGGIISDPMEHGQNPSTIHGSVLRIDLDASDEGYAIPADNPFVDGGGAPEIWAYGLRNPWRIEFDQDLVYISDVGNDWWEEVNVTPLSEAGKNYGWSTKEGPECFAAEECDATGLTEPTFPVYHERACALVGGPVYRGGAIPELNGHFFYGDWCLGWIRSFEYKDGVVQSETEWTELTDVGNLNSFAVDARGEMYVMNLAGDLFRIVPVRAGLS